MQRTGYQLIGIRHIRIDMADICVCETFIHGQLDNGPQREGRLPPLIGKCFRGINASQNHAHHLALYASIRLFSAIGYWIGFSADNASRLTSDGVWQWNLSCGLSSA